MGAMDIEQLRARVRGTLIQPGDGEYDSARKVYNAMIDKRPALIVRCVDTADVIASVNYARANDMVTAIRGGGHNGAGLGTCDDGIVIDLSRMKGIRVDPVARTVRVEAGCTGGEMDHATHAFGLATPSGTVSTTGMAGLTLGGGIGHLTRPFGLTIDNLLEADVVLADGRFVTANEKQHADLYLGAARRRRQLRRRHLVPVPSASGDDGERGSDVLADRAGAGSDEGVSGVHPPGARGRERLPRIPDRTAGAALSAGDPRQEGVRDHLVLDGGSGESGQGDEGDADRGHAAARSRRADAVSRPAGAVRSASAGRAAVVLACGLREDVRG